MNEGHNELQHAIDAWETRRVAAMRAAREAEIVLPFLRAAVEELEAFGRSGDLDVPHNTSTNVEQLRPAQPAVTPPAAPVDAPMFEPAAHAEPIEPAVAPMAQPTPEPMPEPMPEPTPAVEFEDNSVFNDDTAPEPAPADQNDDSFTGFGRKSIASLIDEANRDKEATG